MITLAMVPISSAASAPGTILPSFFGQVKTMTRDSAPTSVADHTGSMTASGIFFSAGMVPLFSGSWPNRRDTCSAMMMAPMPLMKPETTG